MGFSVVPDPMFEEIYKDGFYGIGSTVAVIDSGISLFSTVRKGINQEDVKDFIVAGGDADDQIQHGTYVASIVKRYARGARIIAAKVGEAGDIDQMRTMAAIEWAVLKGAKIINLSLGFPSTTNCRLGTCVFCSFLAQIVKYGVVIVAAAGNKLPGVDKISCPAMSDHVLAVGGVDINGSPAEYSVKSPVKNKPNILAPGTVFSPDGESNNGTSFAAPVVSAALAIIGARAGYENAKKLLLDTASPIEDNKYPTGNGLLNVQKAWEVYRNERAYDSSKGS